MVLESLGKIDRPAVRSVAAAFAASSAVTLVSALIIGFTQPEDRNRAHQTGVVASVLALAGGATYGLLASGNLDRQAKKVAEETSSKEDKGWKDWRDFIVDRKVKESEEITSFYLKPKDGGAIPNFQPGQFLTIKLDIPGQDKAVIRTYSLSDYIEPVGHYRLSIKREAAPKGLDVSPGVASSFMHDRVEQGTVIQAKPPSGRFVVDLEKSSPVVLLSNGVGITPMISMAKAIAAHQPQRQVWFIHGAKNREYHAFEENIRQLSQNLPNFHLHYRYSRPRPEDAGSYHSDGHVDLDLVKALVAPKLQEKNDADYFLCGSPPFLESLRSGLQGWGVAEEKVHFESFNAPPKKAKSEAKTDNGKVETAEVVFARSGKTVTWNDGDGTLLELAENNGLDPDYSCRQGVCLTCMCAISEGEVEYEEPPAGTPDEGSVLICVSRPKTAKVVLDV